VTVVAAETAAACLSVFGRVFRTKFLLMGLDLEIDSAVFRADYAISAGFESRHPDQIS
jgi:hypothetical protein